MPQNDDDAKPDPRPPHVAAGDSTIDPWTASTDPGGESSTPFGMQPTLEYQRPTDGPESGGRFTPPCYSSLVAEQKYRIVRPLASGGLGQVLLAQDEVLGREVALKHIRGDLIKNKDLVNRFLVEAQITGNLEHPGIVGVYAIGEDEAGQPFYVMRLIRGESLRESIRRHHDESRAKQGDAERSRGLRKLVNRLVAVSNAVAFAHSRGVLHRDLKPANIMIGKYGETLVVDWGLAKRLYKSVPGGDVFAAGPQPDIEDVAEITASGMVVGTPAYMSPEQALGRQDLMEPTSDVYSLGATLYEILTGSSPLRGSSVVEILTAVRAGRIPAPREADPSVDAALEAICRKAMALDPDDRYTTARALADDLERWLADEPVVAFREPATRALTRWLTRHPTVLIRGLVTVVALLGLALACLILALGFRGGW